MIKDVLKDIVQYTHGIAGVELIKISGSKTKTEISAVAADTSVIIYGETKHPVEEFQGVCGLAQLNKLKTILAFSDYDENENFSVIRDAQDSNPVEIDMKNQSGDFAITYRFMGKTVIEELVKHVTFNGATWGINFLPSSNSISRFKRQQSASDENTFSFKLEGSELKCIFGNIGSFVFHSGVSGKLLRELKFPTKQFVTIMEMAGDKVIKLSDQGVMNIRIDSGISTYTYLIPAHR